MNAVICAVEGLIHWLITQAYLKAAYETSQLIDKGVIFSEPAKLAAVRRFKRCIHIANVLCPLLVLAFAVGIFFGEKSDNYWLLGTS